MITPQALPDSRRAASTVEVLEARIAPAVLSPGLVTYTDADGDTVKVQIEGGFDSVDFLTVGGSDALTSGGDLTAIVVTGAGADFSLTFADGNTGAGAGDGVISLGVISGPAGAKLPVIKGIHTVQTEAGTTFELGGYKGVGFSKGGGLHIDGGLVAVAGGTGGLELDKIGGSAVVSLRDGVEAGTLVTVKTVVGRLSIGGEIDSSVALGKVRGTLELGEVSSTVTIDAAVTGRIAVGETTVDSLSGDPVGLIWIKNKLRPQGLVTGGDSLNLQIDRDLSGTIRVQGDLFLKAGARLLDADITTGDDVTLNVAGNALGSTLTIGGRLQVESQVGGSIKDSAVASFDNLNLAIGSSVTNSRIVTAAEGLITVGGALLDSQLSSGADLSVSVVERIAGSEVLPDGSLILEVSGTEKKKSGGITKSVIGSRDGGLRAGIAGDVVSNTFLSHDGAQIEVGRSWKSNELSSGFDAELIAVRKIEKSSFVTGFDLIISTSASISASQMVAANDLAVTAGLGGISDLRMETAEGDLSVTSIGTVKKSVMLAGRDALISTEADIASSVLVHSTLDAVVSTTTEKVAARISAGRDVTVTSEGAFTGAIRAGEDLSVNVGRFTPASGKQNLAPGLPDVPSGVRAGGDLALQTSGAVKAKLIEIDGDVIDLRVGGNFSAILRAGGDLVLGEVGTNVTAIAGKVSARSVIQVSGDLGDSDSAAKVVFADTFGGQLRVGGDLRADLEFGASVSRIHVGGSIGEAALGNDIAQIIVNGGVGEIRSGSLFVRADAGGGSFVDGTGTITGTLQAVGRADKITLTALV